MPIIKSAKKKLRQDKKRTVANKKLRETYKQAVRAAREEPKAETISAAYSALDRAAKKNIIHKNKAARLKAEIAKIKEVKKTAATARKKSKKKVSKKTIKKNIKKAAKKATKKTAVKKKTAKAEK